MNFRYSLHLVVPLLSWGLVSAAGPAHAADPLPSWRAGAAKQRIVAFVKGVSSKASKDYVTPADRIADDKAGKPVAIHKFIGRRPIAAFGNSDGDFEMLEYVTAGAGARLGAIVHHDDADREYAYDRKSTVGRLDKALDGWQCVAGPWSR